MTSQDTGARHQESLCLCRVPGGGQVPGNWRFEPGNIAHLTFTAPTTARLSFRSNLGSKGSVSLRYRTWHVLSEEQDLAVVLREAFDLKADSGGRLNIIDRAPSLARQLTKLLTAYAGVAASPGPAVAVDPEREKALRTLGYVRD